MTKVEWLVTRTSLDRVAVLIEEARQCCHAGSDDSLDYLDDLIGAAWTELQRVAKAILVAKEEAVR